MPTLTDIKNTINPSAVPAGSDLIYAFKADGTPAAYTLDQLAAFTAGVTLPTWLTDNAIGAHVRLAEGSGSEIFGGNVIAFNTIIHDSGFYSLGGAFIIPDNVTRVQIAAGARFSNGTPMLSIVKNGDLASRIAVTVGAQGYVNIVTPELVVVSGDYFQAYAENTGSTIYTDSATYFSIKTTEKLT